MGSRTLPEDSRTALLELAEDTSTEGREALKAALREYKAAGWSYRQLGGALSLSHEYIRKLINAAGPQGSPIPPPQEAPRKPAVLDLEQLPGPIVQDLKARFEAALTPAKGPQQGPLSPAVEAFYAGLAGAVAAGWTPYEVGTAIGIHPRAAGRFAAAYARHAAPSSLPVYQRAPERSDETAWNARPPVEAPVVIPTEASARLDGLRDDAAANRGGSRAAAEYTIFLTYWYLRGASREELEKATGQQWTTLRRRLLRWGVMRDPARA